MNRRILILLIVPLFLLSCVNTKKHDKLCTMIYAMIEITIKDSLNKPVILDNFEVRIINTNQLLPAHPDSSLKAQGIYTLLTDSEIWFISEKGTAIRFTGFRNSTEIVASDYIVDQDGCHINLVSGEKILTINPR
jgi:hypothetical protein